MDRDKIDAICGSAITVTMTTFVACTALLGAVMAIYHITVLLHDLGAL